MANEGQDRHIRLGLELDNLKTCPKCKVDKPVTEFSINRARRDGLAYQCRKCNAEHNKKAQQEDPDRFYFYNTKKLYGVDKKRYEEMLAEQDGKCRLCFKEPEKGSRKRLYIDHCASTGVVRGLLCSECNSGIGFLKHDVEILKRAIEYLS